MPRKINFAFAFSLLLSCTLLSCGITNSNTRGKVEAPEETITSEITFDTIQALIIIEAEVNGHKGKFLFDNGFTLSALSPEFATECGVTFNQSTTVNDINNKKTSLPETTVSSMVIGGFNFKKTGVYQIDTKKFFPCNEIDGVIGGSIINKANWKIRYRNRVIEVSEKPFQFGDSASVIPVSFNRGNSALTKIKVREQEITCKIDIGSSGEMAIKKAKYLHLFQEQSAIQSDGISSLGATGLGNIEHNFDIASRITISSGNNTLPVRTEIELEQSQKYDGYIGIGYLRHYDVILNSTKNTYVLANPIHPAENLKKNYGINLYIVNDTCRVIQKNGFDPLMRDIPLMSAVTLIDDTPTSDFRSVCDLRAFMRQKIKSKTDLILQLEKNEELIVLPYREVVCKTLQE